jgi:hypothetical protein
MIASCSPVDRLPRWSPIFGDFWRRTGRVRLIDRIAGRQGPFSVVSDGLGLTGSRGRPRIGWLGLGPAPLG